MTLALTLLHILTIFIMLPRGVISEVWHDGCWLIKFVFVIIIWIMLFLIPNDILRIWLKIALFGTLTYSFLIMTLMVHGTLKLNMLIFNGSIRTRKIAYFGGFGINLTTAICIFG